MQAYKAKAKIDQSGQLIITEPTTLTPGDVEVIILQETKKVASANDVTNNVESVDNQNQVQYQSKFMREWSANNSPVSPEFDPEKARIEALEEKYL